LKTSSLIDARQIAGRLESGSASRVDIVALLISIRGDVPDDMVKDIAHCVAHSERDRGVAHKYIEAFLDHFLAICQDGGLLEVGILFPMDELVHVLVDDLNRIGVETDRDSLRRHELELERLLAQILDGTIIKLRNPSVRNCHFRAGRSDEENRLAFALEVKEDVGRILPLQRGAKLMFPVFSDIS
jgi:hypothetical protein